jgi:hypothetical protein
MNPEICSAHVHEDLRAGLAFKMSVHRHNPESGGKCSAMYSQYDIPRRIEGGFTEVEQGPVVRVCHWQGGEGTVT